MSEKPQGSCRVVFREPLVAVGCYMWGVGRGCREERGTLKGPGLWLSLQRCFSKTYLKQFGNTAF